MASETDERVLSLRFDNSKFESKAKQSIKTIGELNSKLKIIETAKTFLNLEKQIANFTLSPLLRSTGEVTKSFSAMEVAAITSISKITSAAIDAGAQIAKALSVDQLSAGWSKMDEVEKASRTIMAAGYEAADVEKALEKLMWYTDETSYNFVDMANNIGKFTAQGVDLDEAADAMMGISNWAAMSGQGAGEASRAMYNLAQALSLGKVTTRDWMSIENANMSTKAFKEQVIETAKTIGTLDSEGYAIDKTGNRISDVAVTFENFRDQLQTGFFSKDVLVATLQDYNKYASRAYELSTELGISTAEAMEMIAEEAGDAADEIYGLSKTAFKMAQEATSFTDSINYMRDAISSMWMRIYQTIFGTVDDIKVFWTDFCDYLYDVFAVPVEKILTLLGKWNKLESQDASGKVWTQREKLITGIQNAIEHALEWLNLMREAWSEVFPPKTAQQLAGIVNKFFDWSEALEYTETTAARVRAKFKNLFTVIKNIKDGVVKLATSMKPLIDAFANVKTSLEKVIQYFSTSTKETEKMASPIDRLASKLNAASTIIFKLSESLKGKIVPVLKVIKKYGSEGLAYGFYQAATSIKKAIEDIIKEFTGIDLSNSSLSKFLDGIINTIANVIKNFKKVASTVIGYAKRIYNAFAPIIFNLINTIIKYAPAIGNLIASIYQTTAPLISAIMSLIIENLPEILNIIRSIASSIFGVLTPIVNIIRIIAKAFGSVFGIEGTISGLISTIGQFVKGLLTNKQVLQAIYKISQTFFTVIKAILSIIKALSPYIDVILDKLMKVAGVVLKIGGFLAQGLANGLGKVITVAVNIFKSLIEAVKNVLGVHSPSKVFMWIGSMMAAGLFGGFLAGSSGFKEIIQPIIGILKTLLNIIQNVLNTLYKSGDLEGFLVNVAKTIRSIAAVLPAVITAIGQAAEALVNSGLLNVTARLLTIIGTLLSNVLSLVLAFVQRIGIDQLTSDFSKLYNLVKNGIIFVWNLLKNLFSYLDANGEWIISTIGNFAKSIATLAIAIAAVKLTSITKIFDFTLSLTKVTDSWAKKNIAGVVKSFATSFLYLAASLAILKNAGIDIGAAVGGIVAGLLGAMVVVEVYLKILNKFAKESFNSEGAKAVSKAVTSFALSMFVITIGINNVINTIGKSNLTSDEGISIIKSMIGVMAQMVVVISILMEQILWFATGTTADQMKNVPKMLLSLAASFLLISSGISNIIKSLGKNNIKPRYVEDIVKPLGGVMITMALSVSGIILASKLIKGDSSSTIRSIGQTILLLGASLLMVTASINSIIKTLAKTETDTSEVWEVVVPICGLLLALTGAIALIFTGLSKLMKSSVEKSLSKALEKFAKSGIILSIGVSLALIISSLTALLAVLKLANIDTGHFIMAIISIAVIIAGLTASVAVLMNQTKKLDGGLSELKYVSGVLLAMAGSFAIIMNALSMGVATMSVAKVQPGNLLVSVGSIVAVIGSMTTGVKSIINASKASAKTVGVNASGLKAIAKENSRSMLAGKGVTNYQSVSDSLSSSDLGQVPGLVLAMGVSIAIVAKAIGSAASSVGKDGVAIGDFKTVARNISLAILAMSVGIAGIIAVTGAFGKEDIANNLKAISVLLLSMSISMSILSGVVKSIVKNVVSSGLIEGEKDQIVSFMWMLAGIVGALMGGSAIILAVSKIGGNGSYKDLLSVAVLLMASLTAFSGIAEIIRLFTKITSNGTDLSEAEKAVGVILVAVAAILAGLATIVGLSKGTDAERMAEITKSIMTMTIMISAILSSIIIIGAMGIDNIMAICGGLGIVFLTLAASFVIISAAGLIAKKAVLGLAIIAGFFAVLAGVLAGIAAIIINVVNSGIAEKIEYTFAALVNGFKILTQGIGWIAGALGAAVVMVLFGTLFSLAMLGISMFINSANEFGIAMASFANGCKMLTQSLGYVAATMAALAGLSIFAPALLVLGITFGIAAPGFLAMASSFMILAVASKIAQSTDMTTLIQVLTQLMSLPWLNVALMGLAALVLGPGLVTLSVGLMALVAAASIVNLLGEDKWNYLIGPGGILDKIGEATKRMGGWLALAGLVYLLFGAGMTSLSVALMLASGAVAIASTISRDKWEMIFGDDGILAQTANVSKTLWLGLLLGSVLYSTFAIGMSLLSVALMLAAGAVAIAGTISRDKWEMVFGDDGILAQIAGVSQTLWLGLLLGSVLYSTFAIGMSLLSVGMMLASGAVGIAATISRDKWEMVFGEGGVLEMIAGSSLSNWGGLLLGTVLFPMFTVGMSILSLGLMLATGAVAIASAVSKDKWDLVFGNAGVIAMAANASLVCWSGLLLGSVLYPIFAVSMSLLSGAMMLASKASMAASKLSFDKWELLFGEGGVLTLIASASLLCWQGLLAGAALYSAFAIGMSLLSVALGLAAIAVALVNKTDFLPVFGENGILVMAANCISSYGWTLAAAAVVFSLFAVGASALGISMSILSKSLQGANIGFIIASLTYLGATCQVNNGNFALGGLAFIVLALGITVLARAVALFGLVFKLISSEMVKNIFILKDVLIDLGKNAGNIALLGLAFIPLALGLIALGGAVLIFGAAAWLLGEGLTEITEAFEWFKNNIVQPMNDAIAKVKEKFESIKTTISNLDLLGWLKDFGGKIMGGFKSGIEGAWNGIKEAGKNVVEGVKEGVSGAWEKTKGFFGKVADGVVDIFTGKWDENSPSKVFEKIGSFLMEGLENGIEDKVSSVKKSAGSIADSITEDTEGSFFDKIADFFSGLGKKLKDGFAKIKGLFTGETSLASLFGLDGLSSGTDGLLGGLTGGLTDGLTDGLKLDGLIDGLKLDSLTDSIKMDSLTDSIDVGSMTGSLNVGLDGFDTGIDMSSFGDIGANYDFGSIMDGIDDISENTSATAVNTGELSAGFDTSAMQTPTQTSQISSQPISTTSSRLASATSEAVNRNIENYQAQKQLDNETLTKILDNMANGQSFENTFNITSSDPKSVAQEVSDIIARQARRKEAAWA